MNPFVALTTTIDPQGGVYRKPLINIFANYLGAISRTGLTPVLITPSHSPDQISDLLDICSGLVLSGGEDIDPSRYGEEPVPELESVSQIRDAMEFTTLGAALERDMPVLGICRGMQLLNVYFGGTLYQDLATQREKVSGHNQPAPWGKHHHRVQCSDGSRLHEILGECVPLDINSFHHQAVKDLAPGIRCTAEAEDGLIEGIESVEHDWVVGVQWHPERHEAEAPSSDPNIRILEAFAAEVRSYRDRAREGGPAERSADRSASRPADRPAERLTG